ncbi:MAG TPA: glutamate racemase [Acidobacteriaceae bacterium]|nr:glutamate racemase [Acidobacteriaceae bacterium]
MSSTIGVFDSGFGGLTVLRELLSAVPDARYLYLGDTARLPYGSKSRETIVRYALSSARFLQERGAQLLVVACNTATALALNELRAALPIPVIGVIDPGTRAAARACPPSGDTRPTVLVLATQATVESHAYARSCEAAGLHATEMACPLLVPLVEEGWVPDGDINAKSSVTSEVLRIYLLEALAQTPDARAVLLGCTHYPLLRSVIERTLLELHHPIAVIDSAHATAQVIAEQMRTAVAQASPGACEFFATDSVDKFARLGTRFLRRHIEDVKLVDLGG